MKTTLIRDAIIVADGAQERGSLLIDAEGRIADVVKGSAQTPSADVVIDASEMLLLPGAIDAHVHFRDPGLTHKATMASESAAAVAGGVTTVFDMPNTVPQTTTIEALEAKAAHAAANMRTNYAFYIGATNSNIDQIQAADYTTVAGVKLFLGSSTGGMLVDGQTQLQEVFAKSPAIIAAHCEDETIIRENSERMKQPGAPEVRWRDHNVIRSREACIRSSQHAVELARGAGARLHIMHISTAEELSLLDAGDNRRITGEACPSHLWFTCDDYDRLGPLLKANPAVKETADRAAIRLAVANGLITTIGTDHAPHTLEEKQGHSYWQTPSGMPMIQHSLPLMLQLAQQEGWPLSTVAARMAEGVADLYDVADRGHIRVGQWADLALVARRPQTIGTPLYKCGWTPLEGETLSFSVDATFLNGQLVYADGLTSNTQLRNAAVAQAFGRQVRFNR